MSNKRKSADGDEENGGHYEGDASMDIDDGGLNVDSSDDDEPVTATVVDVDVIDSEAEDDANEDDVVIEEGVDDADDDVNAEDDNDNEEDIEEDADEEEQVIETFDDLQEAFDEQTLATVRAVLALPFDRNLVMNYDEEEWYGMTCALRTMWTPKLTDFGTIDLVKEMYPHLQDTTDIGFRFNTYLSEATLLTTYLKEANLVRTNRLGEGRFEVALLGIHRAVYEAYMAAIHLCGVGAAIQDAEVYATMQTLDNNMNRFNNIGLEPPVFDDDGKVIKPQIVPFRELVKYMTDWLQLRQYYKYNGKAAQRKIIQLRNTDPPVFYKTTFLETKGSIKDLIMKDAIKKETNMKMWEHLTSNGRDVALQVASFIENFEDGQFPDVSKKVSLNVFSFADGLFCTDPVSIHYYDMKEEQPFTRFACQHIDELLPPKELFCETNEDGKVTKLDLNDSTLFSRSTLLQALETPNFDKILTNQNFDEFTRFHFHVMFGRVIGGYRIGDHDNWQTTMMVIGATGCGKSTLVEVGMSYFPTALVGLIDATLQETFGLSIIMDKAVWFMVESSARTKLTRTQFNSLSCGDPLTFNVKHMNAKTLPYTSPGMIVGNETIEFGAACGSVERRSMIFYMPNKAMEVDGDLKKKIMKERGPLLVKSVLCYLMAARQYGNKDIWDYSPDSVISHREINSQLTNVLQGFLKSNDVRLFPKTDPKTKDYNKQTSETDFRNAFFAWIDANQRGSRPSWTPQYYEQTFKNLGIQMVAKQNKTTGQFKNVVNGCRLLSQAFNNGEGQPSAGEAMGEAEERGVDGY